MKDHKGERELGAIDRMKGWDFSFVLGRCLVLAVAVLIMLGVWGFPGPAHGAVFPDTRCRPGGPKS
jgi:hypothetical protein